MRVFALLALVIGLSSPAWAQEGEPSAPPPPASDPQIDATKLGVSLERIQKGLRITEARDRQRQAGDALRLEFQVQVYGMAPKIDVLKGVDLSNSPVPGTAPTHREVIDFVTPQIYRTPGLPISTLVEWAVAQAAQKSKRTRCEEEIAAYRQLIVQGVNVSAPRCTQ